MLADGGLEQLSMDEAEYCYYWETKRFFESEELQSWGLDEAFSGYYDSSSPDGGASPSPAKNIVMERNRRSKLNERFYALRSVVPKITKMDKASTIKDAINYIQELQEQERRMMAEISELESVKEERVAIGEIECADQFLERRNKKRKARSSPLAPALPATPSIEVMELRVCEVGDRIMAISINCNKKRDTMIRVCEVFETLNLKIITANITSVSGSLLHTLFVEANDMNSTQLKEKIETVIADLDAQTSRISVP